MYRNRKITLSVTSCKRIDLLRRVLKAFVVFCKDIHNLDEIIFFDDSSTTEEKEEMEAILDKLFPNTPKIITHFYPNSFPDNYRHARVLNSWRDKLIESDSDYTLHLEDDYLFVNHFSLSECVDLLEDYPEYGYVSLNQSWKNFPPEYKPKEIGNYWEWIYLKDKKINECLFLDDVAGIQQPFSDMWIMYINWPSFSLRPGMMSVKKLLYIGEFSTTYDTKEMSVELEFAIRWGNKFKSLCSKNFNIINLALDPEKSAYNINNSNR